MSDDRPHRRPIAKRRTEAARHAPSWSPFRDGRCCVAAAQRGRLIHRLRHLREQFADLQAGHIRRNRFVLPANIFGRVGLGIEAVVMRQPATEINKHNRLGPGFRRALLPGRLLRTQHRGQRQAERGQSADAQKVPAFGAAALTVRFIPNNIKHAGSPLTFGKQIPWSSPAPTSGR